MTRIKSTRNSDKPRISRDDVVAFFQNRSRRLSELGPLRAVIYQDKHPDLAERRDRAEKNLLLPLLDLNGTQRLLDLGCGSGRWAEEICEQVEHYHGLDISSGLVDYARSRFRSNPRMRFSVGTVDSFTLASLKEERPFSRILCSGVLIYLNDEEMERALGCIAAASDENATILVREPIALETRLSIVQHYSDELEDQYNAIYRTQSEIESAIARAMGNDFTLTGSGDVYLEENLNNRTETRQRWLKVTRGRHP